MKGQRYLICQMGIIGSKNVQCNYLLMKHNCLSLILVFKLHYFIGKLTLNVKWSSLIINGISDFFLMYPLSITTMSQFRQNLGFILIRLWILIGSSLSVNNKYKTSYTIFQNFQGWGSDILVWEGSRMLAKCCEAKNIQFKCYACL